MWKESAIFDGRERALLALTESLTNVRAIGVPGSDFNAINSYFSEEDITKLTVAIGKINIWNRLAVGFRTQHPID